MDRRIGIEDTGRRRRRGVGAGAERITPEVDPVIRRLYSDILGGYWPSERRLVEEGYRTIPFPFDEIAPQRFSMAALWDLHRLLGYLGTWSAVGRYRGRDGSDPLDLIRVELDAAWGDPGVEREVVWPPFTYEWAW